MSGDGATGDASASCGAGTKLCGAVCVATDVAHGCEGTSCDPCINGQHATGAACVATKCSFASNAGYAHCTTLATDGCETAITTDRLNCGACGHSCLGGDCAAGICQPIVLSSAQNFPTGIAVDATNVYWTNYKITGALGYAVQKVAKDATGQGTIASSNTQDVYAPISVATDGTNVYWANYYGNGGVPKTINQIGVNGANLVQLGSGDGTSAIALGGGSVWWGNRYATVKIGKVAIGGGSVVAFAQRTSAIADYDPGGVVADATHVYWTNSGAGTIYAQPLGTPCTDTSCTVFVTDPTTGPGALAMDASTLYWVSFKDGTIRSRKKDGTGQKTLAINQPATNIATDGTSVYWTLHDFGAVRSTGTSAATCDGAACKTYPQTTPSGLYQNGIAVDATAIYWTAQTSGAGGDNAGLVVKIAK